MKGIRTICMVMAFVMIFSLAAFATVILTEENILTTQDLLEDALADDDWMMFFAGGTVDLGYKMAYARNESLQEFFKRPDCASVALNVYSNSIWENFSESNYTTVEEYKEYFLWLILSSDEMMSLYTSAQYDIYNTLSIQRYVTYQDQYLCDSAALQMRECITCYWSGFTLRHSHPTVTLFYNNDVWTFFALEDMTNIEKAEDIEYVESLNLDVTLLSEPTYHYNCHSYAWYQQDTSNQHWIYIEQMINVLQDYHCYETVNPAIGHIVVYMKDGEITHSGVIVGFENGVPIVRSKWGRLGLYEHPIDQILNGYYDGTENSSYRFYYYPKEHDLHYSQINANVHYAECDSGYCEYEIEEEPHDNIYTYDHITHTAVCEKCGYTLESHHTMVSFTDSVGVGTKCSACNYKLYDHYHTYSDWIMYSEVYHRRMCHECYYMEDEKHHAYYDYATQSCTKCGYHGILLDY